MASPSAYPPSFRGKLVAAPGRWLWLLKVLLVIPHPIVLALLWMVASVVTLLAFFTTLFTAHYPRGFFNFNVGVLRWNWRVAFYGCGSLGTDRYPPFSLWSTDYPADLNVDYPQRLSRGLVLIKWWLLALPHLLIVGIIQGGASVTGRVAA